MFGRFPVIAEIRLKKRSDASFPNEKTLKDRFGTRQQFAAKVLAYCESHDRFEDIAAIYTTALNVPNADAEADDGMPQQDGGFVYLIKSGRFYKVGRSNSAGRREYELAIQLPAKATTVHTIRAG
jgi:hypothetical protein